MEKPPNPTGPKVCLPWFPEAVLQLYFSKMALVLENPYHCPERKCPELLRVPSRWSQLYYHCVSIPGPVSRGVRPAPQCPCPLQRYPEPVPLSAALCRNPAMARGWAVTSPWEPSSASIATPAMPCRGPQKSSASLFLGPWPSGMYPHPPAWVSTWTARTPGSGWPARPNSSLCSPA